MEPALRDGNLVVSSWRTNRPLTSSRTPRSSGQGRVTSPKNQKLPKNTSTAPQPRPVKLQSGEGAQALTGIFQKLPGMSNREPEVRPQGYKHCPSPLRQFKDGTEELLRELRV